MIEGFHIMCKDRSRSQMTRVLAVVVLAVAAFGVLTHQGRQTASAVPPGGDWPQWGRDHTRNMVTTHQGLPVDFSPGKFLGRSDEIDMASTLNVKWIAELGSQAYGNTTIADGRVYIGTNNDLPRDPKYKDDRSVVYCLDEKTGELIWQLAVPKLGTGKVSDWEFLGICSSPAVVGSFVYVVTNRCEVVCLDVHGMANGNDGPFTDEAKYLGGSGKPPIQPGPTDADIIWIYDMLGELGIFPHNVTSSSALVHDGAVYVSTSNGVDWSHVDIPNTRAPCLIKLDARTGELLGEEASGISQRILHCNWSSPAYGDRGGRGVVLFGAGDGFCYGFDPDPVKDEEGFGVLKELWRFDCNPQQYRFKDNKPIKYGKSKGPSEIIATPVFYKGRAYAVTGQDPEHGEGVGTLSCIDVSQSGHITDPVWQYRGIERSISTPSIEDDLLYVADYTGFIHCLDVNTGDLLWKHDTLGHIWGSTLVADGKVFIGNEDGFLTILATGRKLQKMGEVEFPAPIYSSAVAANGVLYVATQSHLYAFSEGGT